MASFRTRPFAMGSDPGKPRASFLKVEEFERNLPHGKKNQITPQTNNSIVYIYIYSIYLTLFNRV